EGIRYQPGDAPTRIAAPPVGGIGMPGRGVGLSGGVTSGAGALRAGAVGVWARAGTPGKPSRPARRVTTASHLSMVIASRQTLYHTSPRAYHPFAGQYRRGALVHRPVVGDSRSRRRAASRSAAIWCLRASTPGNFISARMRERKSMARLRP